MLTMQGAVAANYPGDISKNHSAICRSYLGLDPMIGQFTYRRKNLHCCSKYIHSKL